MFNKSTDIMRIIVNIIADEENTKILGVDYAGLGTLVAIQGCKELKEKIRVLEDRLAALETNTI